MKSRPARPSSTLPGSTVTLPSDAETLPCPSGPPVSEGPPRMQVTPGTVARACRMPRGNAVGRGTCVAANPLHSGPTQSLFVDPSPGVAGRRAPRVPDAAQGGALAAVMAGLGRAIRADRPDDPSRRAEAPLRQAVVDRVSDLVPWPVSPDHVALTRAGQTVPAETDGHGMVPAALDADRRRHGARVTCRTPDAQPPAAAYTGTGWRARIAAPVRPVARRTQPRDREDVSESGG
jgi:hypothetical protein